MLKYHIPLRNKEILISILEKLFKGFKQITKETFTELNKHKYFNPMTDVLSFCNSISVALKSIFLISCF